MFTSCAENCRRDFPGVEFFFQPADIVSQILNFGLPAPVDIQIVGADCARTTTSASRSRTDCATIPGTADVHVQQMMSLPTLYLDMDRTRINQVGLTAQNVAQSVLISLSGSFQTAPNFWLNRGTVSPTRSRFRRRNIARLRCKT